jgi:hypothetical protein
MVVRGTTGLRRGTSPLAKQHLAEEYVGTMTTQGVGAVTSRSNLRKMNRKEKLGEKENCVYSIVEYINWS